MQAMSCATQVHACESFPWIANHELLAMPRTPLHHVTKVALVSVPENLRLQDAFGLFLLLRTPLRDLGLRKRHHPLKGCHALGAACAPRWRLQGRPPNPIRSPLNLFLILLWSQA